MASIDKDTMKGMLQALEHMLAVDRTSACDTQLVNAKKSGKPLAPSTLAYYGQQLDELSRQRGQMRGVIARWWTLVEERQ